MYELLCQRKDEDKIGQLFTLISRAGLIKINANDGVNVRSRFIYLHHTMDRFEQSARLALFEGRKFLCVINK